MDEASASGAEGDHEDEFRPKPDIPTGAPQVNRRWFANQPCAHCGKHIDIALYHLMGKPFCDAVCATRMLRP